VNLRIREYKDKPDLKDQRAWTFWQQKPRQNSRHRENVDLNVFYGDAEQWQQFLQKNKLN
jgi:lysozyme